MLIALQIFSMMVSLFCYGDATKEYATKFERVLFITFSLLFVIVVIIIEGMK